MPRDYESVPVKDARQAVRKWVMRAQGGSCFLKFGDRSRLLIHDPGLDSPEMRLPWPLNLLQPHELQYSEYLGEDMVEMRRFHRSQSRAAVAYFLRDVDPEEEVQFNPSRTG
jgi:hypothetical protein